MHTLILCGTSFPKRETTLGKCFKSWAMFSVRTTLWFGEIQFNAGMCLGIVDGRGSNSAQFWLRHAWSPSMSCIADMVKLVTKPITQSKIHILNSTGRKVEMMERKHQPLDSLSKTTSTESPPAHQPTTSIEFYSFWFEDQQVRMQFCRAPSYSMVKRVHFKFRVLDYP